MVHVAVVHAEEQFILSTIRGQKVMAFETAEDARQWVDKVREKSRGYVMPTYTLSKVTRLVEEIAI